MSRFVDDSIARIRAGALLLGQPGGAGPGAVRAVLGVAVMTARQPWGCPDRGAVPVERQLVHADTCPLGAAQDKVAAGDRGCFEAHPHTQSYSRPTRPISRSEVLELKVIGVIPDGWDTAGYVTVTRIGPGVRARSFDGIRIFPRGVVA